MIPFAADARQRFDHLAIEHGLVCVIADESYVRYENDSAFLSVRYDNGRSYELGVEIGQRSNEKAERPFSLAEILRLKKYKGVSEVDGLTTNNKDSLRRALTMLASLVETYAAQFLSGNDFSFAQVAKLRKDESVRYAARRDLRSARLLAEKAWEAKDYAGVVAALKPVKNLLSPSDLKRLEHSSNKVRAH